ncbi:MucR family transcriptional regulator [Methylobacterium isbiliense]|jgi:predicted transcriptional regulator|uniref:Transcriptional regulatory protein ros n=1 Tax=Methylobacterium isbiliense TaxID=315478 RepID=A0ABQ4SI51_9HYPH|nr:MucR family transcriptional regulator [Methylobacterium isbiliense]MDN3624145.1 MucR family transcriptional regulator [Methylobacterium isbiliense]GJE01341.1 Transcriptional regulatory protein ros [Methylobacterium isbiliense]
MTASAEGNAGTGSGTVEMAAGLVSAYVSNNPLPMSELPGLIENIHGALVQLAQPAAASPEPPVPPVPIRKSVTPDHIISLEDGKPYKTLKRHLARLGLTPDQYRQKWGLPSTYPMTAANYAAQRSELAKSIGLGQQRSKGRRGKAP